MNIDLSNKVALVGGASQGMGRAVAQELAGLGCQIIAMARDAKALASLMRELEASTQRQHYYIAVDVADKEHLEAEVTSHIKRLGPIEILINNTGGPTTGLITKATAAEFNQAFENHVQTNVLLSRLVLPGMKERQFGRIINISSTSVKIPIADLGVSNTIRWAVTGWAKTLAAEVAADGITVNNVLPGYTDTPRLDSFIETLAKEKNLSKAEYVSQLHKTIPIRRFAKPEEIAAAVAFLATPAASYINGVALAVDGGKTGCI